MSKRLQVVIPDDEYEAIVAAARRRGLPLSHVVRDGLRRSLTEADPDPDSRIAAVLRYARFSGPTGDIETLLEDVERGRDLP